MLHVHTWEGQGQPLSQRLLLAQRPPHALCKLRVRDAQDELLFLQRLGRHQLTRKSGGSAQNCPELAPTPSTNFRKNTSLASIYTHPASQAQLTSAQYQKLLDNQTTPLESESDFN